VATTHEAGELRREVRPSLLHRGSHPWAA
jgi:hypothetical protein